MFAAGYFIIGHSGFAALSDTADKAVDKAKDEPPAVLCGKSYPFVILRLSFRARCVSSSPPAFAERGAMPT